MTFFSPDLKAMGMGENVMRFVAMGLSGAISLALPAKAREIG